MSILYLAKKNNDFVSHCKCENSLIGDSGQLDCPWCGCGWLFSCIKCRKAFSFSEAVNLDKTWEELAHDDLIGFDGKEPSQAEIAEWVEYMKYRTSHLVLGQTYVYLDGCFIPADEENFEFEGLHAKHAFHKPPQIIALEDERIVGDLLENPDYWTQNAINPR